LSSQTKDFWWLQNNSGWFLLLSDEMFLLFDVRDWKRWKNSHILFKSLCRSVAWDYLISINHVSWFWINQFIRNAPLTFRKVMWSNWLDDVSVWIHRTWGWLDSLMSPIAAFRLSIFNSNCNIFQTLNSWTQNRIDSSISKKFHHLKLINQVHMS